MAALNNTATEEEFTARLDGRLDYRTSRSGRRAIRELKGLDPRLMELFATRQARAGRTPRVVRERVPHRARSAPTSYAASSTEVFARVQERLDALVMPR